MSRIQQLDAGVINKIAAGEVIERPANVVKELLENSVDALATYIEVDIGEGGSELIRITDNGQGIHPDDIELAVASHATSKIRSAEDLFLIQTMGFRGEALASIAEVSHLRIRSRQPEALAGVELEVNCGRKIAPQPCGCPVGTTIEIRNLFASTPVRRKFLKTKATEFGHITEQFTRIALANPRLHLVLRHNGRVVFDLPPAGQLVDRLSLFFGKGLAEKLIWVESEANGIRMSGYVAHPSHSKSSRQWQHLFLNGRWFQDRSLQHALTEAYRGLLMVGRQPIAFLFLDMPASGFDVNVHPTKVEVRFLDSQQLYRQLLGTIRTKFLSMELDSELKLDDDPAKRSDDPDESLPPLVSTTRAAQAELDDWVRRETTASGSRGYTGTEPPLTTWSIQTGRRSENQQPEAGAAVALHPDGISSAHSAVRLNDEAEEDARATDLPETADDAARLFVQREGQIESGAEDSVPPAPTEAASVPKPAVSAAPIEDIPRAMQIMDCYLLVETEQGLTIIDQHALHERIMYEYLRPRVLNRSVESQRMLIPETVELPARDAALILEHQELLQQFGFGIEEFGTGTLLVNAHPVMFRRAGLSQIIREMAEQLATSEKQPTRRDLLDSMLHMMSCKAAIKSGQRLTPEEIASLLAQRHLVDDAHHCPHGRPTALTLSQADLDRRFGRLG